MADSSSSERSGSERENDNIQSTMSPITPRTSIASPDTPTFDASEESRRDRRDSNVRFREIGSLHSEESSALPLPTVRDGYVSQAGRQEWVTTPSQPYAELFEERSRLEERVNMLENRLQNLDLPRLSDFSEKGDMSSERSGLNVEPQWMTWQEYLEPTNKATNVLEVLIEKPHTNTRRKTSVTQPADEAPSGVPEVKNIERIRFRSVHIISALQQITEQSFPLSCFTIHRPFKILLFYRDAIEAYVADLEESFYQNTHCPLGDRCRARIDCGEPILGNSSGNHAPLAGHQLGYKARHRTSFDDHSRESGQLIEEETGRQRVVVERQQTYPVTSSNNSDCRHEDSDDLLAQGEAITHLRALVKFMREDMREIFARHDLLRSSKADKIAFIDIWHLFMAGDLVVTNDESNRMIYRVSILPAHRFFSSKRPVKEVKLRSDGSHQQVESVYSEDSMNVMHIDVFHYNFDGRNFGPVETRYVASIKSCQPKSDTSCKTCLKTRKKQLR